VEPSQVTIFTDPGCPFGFNAQRQELQLRWHYGHALRIVPRMIVLRERRIMFADHGLTPERAARGLRAFIDRRTRSRARYGSRCAARLRRELHAGRQRRVLVAVGALRGPAVGEP
jgi:hypothetical protein